MTVTSVRTAFVSTCTLNQGCVGGAAWNDLTSACRLTKSGRPLKKSTVSCFSSSFSGRAVRFMPRSDNSRPANSRQAKQRICMVVDPWSVSPEAIDQLAVQFFGFSLFPYLAFLYFLSRKEIECPPVANFGFRFLLVFVFATIPAGIYAKQACGTILANVDWLHGTAESFLTITNLLIVIGFRQALSELLNSSSSSSTCSPSSNTKETEKSLQSPALGSVAAILLASAATLLSSIHAEPTNALSLPTWIVHSSSLLEWLAAMSLIWQYADVTGRQQWKGLVWAMLPLHTSGICACTYHIFYNAPAVNSLVAIQAGLTCFGNALMAVATWRIVRASSSSTSSPSGASSEFDVGIRQQKQLADRDYYTRLAVGTVALSAFIKWGSLAVDWPFHPSLVAAAALVTIPTGVNIAKWAVRSQTGKEFLGGLL